jgi:signal peptidase I
LDNKDNSILKKNIQTEKQGKKSKTKKSKSREYLDALVFAAIVAFIVKLLLFEAYRIPTGSMENTLLVGDFLLVTKFTYGATTPRNVPFTDIRVPYFRIPGFKSPKLGDVVVFDYPGDRDEVESKEVMNYIKRCVGTPGDTIQVIERVLYNNGKIVPNAPDGKFDTFHRPAKEPNPRIFPKGSGWNEDNYGPLRIPKEGDLIKIDTSNYDRWRIFVMREGYKIELKPDKKVYVDGAELPDGIYKVKRDYYFMMGDNRNNSADSRYWGFVPKQNIVGEALMIYWSWDANISFADFFKLIGTIRWDRIGSLVR